MSRSVKVALWALAAVAIALLVAGTFAAILWCN